MTGSIGTGLRMAVVAGVVALLVSCSGNQSHLSGPTTTGAGPGTSTTSGEPSRTGSTVAPPTSGDTIGKCTMPLTHEADVGFHIAAPNGWDLSTLNGVAE